MYSLCVCVCSCELFTCQSVVAIQMTVVGEAGKTTHESQEQSPTLSRQQRMRILKGSELITKGLLATDHSP